MAQALTSTKRPINHLILVRNGELLLGVRTMDGLEIPPEWNERRSVEETIEQITNHTGLVLQLGTSKMVPMPHLPFDFQVSEAKVVGARAPTASIRDIWEIEWVPPTAFASSTTTPRMWKHLQPVFEAFDLWEPPTVERMRAVVFGSWVHHPGHPTPPRSTVVDVAVGYFGKTRPTDDEMQAFGEREGRKWAERNISAEVDYTVHVHHGMQKPTAIKGKVDKVEFLIPERVTISPGYTGRKDSSFARGGVARPTDTNNERDPRIIVERIIPWAYNGQAFSLSTLLLSATTINELVTMWHCRQKPIILRLDDPADSYRLDWGMGFGLSNLRNAIRHSTHLDVFKHAMNHVPWGELVRKLATKDPNREHLDWLRGNDEPTASLILLPEGVVRVRRRKMFDDYAHRTETQLSVVAKGLADGVYGREGLGSAFIHEPIPYHTICREMFRK